MEALITKKEKIERVTLTLPIGHETIRKRASHTLGNSPAQDAAIHLCTDQNISVLFLECVTFGWRAFDMREYLLVDLGCLEARVRSRLDGVR